MIIDPLFSIVVANYNYGRFLETALKSVMKQTFQAFEIIVCDAASTDNSVEVIRRYAGGLAPNIDRSLDDAMANNSHITWWCSEKDRGQSHAFNKGFSHARGRFLSWLNADDMLYPTALASIAKLIRRNPRAEWFVGSTTWVDNNLNVIKCFCAHRFSVLRARYAFLTAGGPSSFFSKRLYEAAGKIDESLYYLMDTDLWYKFYFKCRVKYYRTRDDVWIFRVHDNSKTTGAVISDSKVARDNRSLYEQETNAVAIRYGWNNELRDKIVTFVTCSLVDKVIATLRTIYRKGRCVIV